MLSMVILATNRFLEGKVSVGRIGRIKSYCSETAREVCAMARDVCGGNGILLDHHVMKQFMDIEAVHTYEGTYEVNMLISGREITGGLNPFK
jgi:alkylation response protein AidB-like acyl-CoA dehydrogenase